MISPKAPARAILTQPLRRALAEPILLSMKLVGYRIAGFPILTYHSVSLEPGYDAETVEPERFKAQMQWLADNGFSAVSVSQLLSHLGSNHPHRIVALTFDDGYRDNRPQVVPVLSRLGFGATIYIATASLGGTSDWNSEDDTARRPIMSAEEIREVHSAGIEIGSHSHTHRDLTKFDVDVINAELATSKAILSDLLAAPVVGFAAPHGRVNSVVATAVQRAGYTHLVGSGRFSLNRPGTSPYALRRITIARGDSLREFGKKVSGCYNWLNRWDGR
jgi:peptidoglycan/xylan/chitin deacetylase (PgdA/CDA1 family)